MVNMHNSCLMLQNSNSVVFSVYTTLSQNTIQQKAKLINVNMESVSKIEDLEFTGAEWDHVCIFIGNGHHDLLLSVVYSMITRAVKSVIIYTENSTVCKVIDDYQSHVGDKLVLQIRSGDFPKITDIKQHLIDDTKLVSSLLEVLFLKGDSEKPHVFHLIKYIIQQHTELAYSSSEVWLPAFFKTPNCGSFLKQCKELPTIAEVIKRTNLSDLENLLSFCCHKPTLLHIIVDILDSSQRQTFLRDNCYNLFSKSCFNECEDTVQCLLEQNASLVVYKNGIRETTLHTAAQVGNLRIARMILEVIPDEERKSFIEQADDDGYSPFFCAVDSGHLKLLQYFRDQHKSEGTSQRELHTIVNKDGWTPLAAAVWYNQLDVVRWLVRIDPEGMKTRSKVKRSVLHYAALNGNIEIASVFLELLEPSDKCALIISLDKYGAISLHNSCCDGHLEFSQWLIDEYEKCKSESDPPLPTIQDKDGWTPLAYAVENNQLDVVRWLVRIDPEGMKTRNKIKRSVLHHAALNGSIVIASVFLEFLEPSDKCALIISPDKDGAISLHNSCSNGHLEFSQWLIDEYEKCKSESDPPLPTIHDKDEHTPLAAAVQINRLDVVRWLASIDPQGMKTRNKVKRSVLHHAALNGNIEIASVFLELLEPSDKCALFISPDKYGAISLHDSCWDGHLEFSQWLIDEYEKCKSESDPPLPTIQDKDGWTPLAYAVQNNQLDVVRWLVRIDPEGMKTRNKIKRSVLHHAALNGNIEIASVFLELLEPSDKCALFISPDKYGAISLHDSCWDGHLEFSQWLIDEYEKCKSESDPPLPTIQDKDGWTPLAYAVQNNQLDVVRWLVRIDPEGMKTRNKIKRSVLHHAALNGNIEIASVFLELLEPSDKCALFISPDKYGAISLHDSCWDGHLEFSQWLIDEYEKCKSESDPPLPTIQDKDGWTPLAYAVQNNQLDVVRWLASIDPQGMKTRNKVKRSVLHHTALNGNIEIASVLLELLEPSDKCALIISPDKDGAISLHNSCSKGHLEFSQWLIDEYEKCKSESDPPLITIHDKDEDTPLAAAVWYNQLDVVRWLASIDPEGMKTRNKAKRSVLHHAAVDGNIEIASVFLELLEPSDKCALIISPDKYGAISLHDSCSNGHLEFSQWLIDEYEKYKTESDPPFITIHDKYEDTPLAYAVLNNQFDVVRWLARIDPEGMKTRNKAKRSVLHHAAVDGHIEIASVFLELLEPSDKCALIISPDKYGAISLHDSCSNGHLEFSQWLIDEYEKCKSESDPPLPTIHDKNEHTPLAVAVQINHFDVVRWLVRIDPEGMKTRDIDKRSVLHHAALNGNIEIASVFLELLEPSDKCGLIISPDKYGSISLLYSCFKGHLEFSQWLIDEYEKCKSESDPPLPTIHDKDEETPLAAAVKNNQIDVVRWLASIDPQGLKT